MDIAIESIRFCCIKDFTSDSEKISSTRPVTIDFEFIKIDRITYSGRLVDQLYIVSLREDSYLSWLT